MPQVIGFQAISIFDTSGNTENDVLLPGPTFGTVSRDNGMSRFAYFEYSGNFPPTIQSSPRREPYHYIVEVSRIESDGHERSLDELLKAARILIKSGLGLSATEVLNSTPPTEITRQDFERMRTVQVYSGVMPGVIYRLRGY